MKKALSSSRVRLEIDLRAIARNYRIISRKAGKPVMVVLKANAYGLGVNTIARTLIAAGASRIGLAELREAEELLPHIPVPIHILGGLTDDEIPAAVQLGIICPVLGIDCARKISQAAVRYKKNAKVHILTDTGMGRLGIRHEDCPEVLRRIFVLPRLSVEGIYTHFANANDPRHPKTKIQLKAFHSVLSSFPEGTFPLVHTANSDAINNFPEACFDMVRTGINLYGVFDLKGRHAYDLTPTLSLKTAVIQIRTLKKGATIGYGCTHTLKKDTIVGTIPAGYADGIPLAASNRGEVLVQGRRAGIIGRVSMDYTTIDLSSCPGVKKGADVVIIGKSGKEEITVEDLARLKKTHPYEIICSLGNRVERTYKS